MPKKGAVAVGSGLGGLGEQAGEACVREERRVGPTANRQEKMHLL